ncbi:hypothetical protein [Mucilaginibacter polytrichastri]|uniref:hypothetical protein n=1 Tax=Mucilaginibacter polytrichastri TaxID=1302689 RepID=UPI00111428FE|nr:hypothetical protein [Mucilaginibacter polytrichastri]
MNKLQTLPSDLNGNSGFLTMACNKTNAALTAETLTNTTGTPVTAWPAKPTEIQAYNSFI